MPLLILFDWLSRSAPRLDAHPGATLLDRHGGRDNRFSPRGGRGSWFGGQSKDMGPGYVDCFQT